MKNEPVRTDIYKMFDRIAGRYDILNKILSFGMVGRWHKRLIKRLPPQKDMSILDLATGSSDVLISLLTIRGDISQAVGLDMSEQMLILAEKKLARHDLTGKVRLIRADAAQIPCPDSSFDTVTMAFGIRNMVDVPGVLREMRRVLKPNGRVLILEFSRPKNRMLNFLYMSYLRNVLPLVGGIISGNYSAYRYLNRTIETFPAGEDFCRLMRDAGFEKTEAEPITFGTVCLYTASK